MKKIQVQKVKTIKVLRSSQVSIAKQATAKVVSSHSRKRPAPQRLGELIKIVNSLPHKLPRYDAIWEQGKELGKRGILLKDAGRDFWLWGPVDEDRAVMTSEWAIRLFVDTIEKLSSSAKEFIGPLNPESGNTLFYTSLRSWNELPAEDTLAASANRYDFLLIARDTLRSIADKWASGSNPEAIIPVEGLVHEETSTPLSLCLEENGQIGRQRSELLDRLFDILSDDNVDARRILRCPICEKIYWAERIDQPTCSPKCNNVRRSRIQRKTYVETRPRFQQKGQETTVIPPKEK